MFGIGYTRGDNDITPSAVAAVTILQVKCVVQRADTLITSSVERIESFRVTPKLWLRIKIYRHIIIIIIIIIIIVHRVQYKQPNNSA